MHTIYKYPLKVTDTQGVEVPNDAYPIHVGLDPVGDLCIWCRVDPNRIRRKMTVRIFGTGHPIDDTTLVFVGTVKMTNFMWHIFVSPILQQPDEPTHGNQSISRSATPLIQGS